MTLDITLVTAGALTKVMGGLGQYLEVAAALTSGRSSVDDIVRMFYTGQYSLWVVFDTETNELHGFFATEVKQYPQRRLLCVQHCSMRENHMQQIVTRMQDLATEFAKANGCSGIEFTGRHGWKKYATTNGYRRSSVTYQKIFDEVAP